MKVLVTGGAGFIGSHVADRLIADGHEVVVVDNLSTGMRENVNPRAEFYQMDLVDPGLKDVFERERPEVVNHHAAHANVTKSMAQPAMDATSNILGSLNLYDCARAVGVRKIVYASTGGALYGNQEHVPVDETHPIELLSNYAVSKYAAELYLRCYAYNYGLTYTVLRYANVYGPRQQPHGESGVVAIFATIMLEGGRPRIFGDGTKTRDYVYVSDVAEANVLAIQRADNESLNIGTGTETKDFQVFDTVRRAVGVQVEPIYAPKRPGEVQRSALSSDKARRLLLWTPQVSFEAGVAATVPYYRQRYGKPART
jgi:UDP-glucose 4-epimerase